MAGRQSYMHRQERDDDSINWGQVALVFIAFAFIYFVTAFYFSTTSFGKEVRLKGRYDQTERPGSSALSAPESAIKSSRSTSTTAV